MATRYVVRTNPRTPKSLAEDPIGDRFDRCVDKVSPKLGERAARAICAKSLNRAHPGELAKARRKADAERRAGLRPARAARGSARTSGTKPVGDVRKGDAFRIGSGPVRVATANAVARRVKGRYHTVVKTSRGSVIFAPQTRVTVLQRVRGNPSRFEKLREDIVRSSARRGYDLQDPSGRAIAAAIGRRKYGAKKFAAMAAAGRKKAHLVRSNPVWEIIQAHAPAPGLRVVEWVDADDARWQDVGTGRRLPPLKPGKHLVTHGAQLVLDQDHGATFGRVLFVKTKHRWSMLGPIGPRRHVSKLKGADAKSARALMAYLAGEMAEHAGRL